MPMSSPLEPSFLRTQNVTREPSGANPNARTDGLTSSGALPRVKLWNCPDPTCVTHTSICPSRSDRKATKWPSRDSDRVSPEVLLPLKPEASANRQRDSRHCQRQNECPLASGRRYRRLRRRSGNERGRIVFIFLRCSKIPAERPGIQLRARSVNRAHPVMHVAVNGHPLPLFPALDRRHVPVQVRGDFLPRIQSVFQWSNGWGCARGWFIHHSPCLVRGFPDPRNP